MERRIVIEGIPLTPKASAGCKSTLAFGSSHEARRRRMAVFFIQLTREPHRTSEPRGLSPSGGISQSSHMSPYAPARPRRSPGSRGTTPCARPVAERRYFAVNSHVSLRPCAPAAQSGVKGYYPLREAHRRAAVFRSQFTCLPTPLRTRGAVRGQGVLPLARGPSPSGGIFAANSHVSLCPCAPQARSPNGGISPRFCRER